MKVVEESRLCGGTDFGVHIPFEIYAYIDAGFGALLRDPLNLLPRPDPL